MSRDIMEARGVLRFAAPHCENFLSFNFKPAPTRVAGAAESRLHKEWKEWNTMVNMQALQTGRSVFISSDTCNQFKCWARSVILCHPAEVLRGVTAAENHLFRCATQPRLSSFLPLLPNCRPYYPQPGGDAAVKPALCSPRITQHLKGLSSNEAQW